MRSTRLARAVVAVTFAVILPVNADADIFVSPFLGLKFRAATNEIDFDNNAGTGDTKLAIGVSGVVISDEGLGLELEVAHQPRFFERTGSGGNVTRSGVTTLGGNVMLALPLSLTRESLRPYAVTGLGLMHASASNGLGFLEVNNDFLGLTLGVGAVGFLTDVAGLRFDLRHIKSVSSSDTSNLIPGEVARLSFWRATVGFVFR